MLTIIKSFLNGGNETPQSAGDSADALAAAAVAVLVETALLDGDFDQREREAIHSILVDRFAISADDAGILIDDAVAGHEDANRVYAATRLIREEFTDAERIDVMEMLWEVAYADGMLHDYEANLVRRVAGLLYVRDRDSGQARKRVLERLGLDTTE
ncbi:TerB family tellurite resistance protein [Thalassospiraceae bacterium LMO-JJ14]|nr:TerB family tellurite resistance protein [Thalassospiraceae bacterium LMO-JJ14]